MVLKVSLNTGINRIRLEFKVSIDIFQRVIISVLIESDWNLKVNLAGSHLQYHHRINRIRLEFKEETGGHGNGQNIVLIESDWNLKFFASKLP